MQNYLPLLFDAAVVIIFIGYISKGMRRGLARSVGEFLSTFGALVLAALGSSILAPLLYEGLFYRGILEMLDSYLAEVASPDMVIAQITKAMESLPKVVQSAVELGLDATDVDLHRLAMLDIEEVSRTVADTIIGPMVTAVLEILFFFVLFAIANYILHLFCRALNLVNYIPLVGSLNSALGGAFGALQAVAVVSVTVMALQLLIAASSNRLEIFNSDLISATVLYSFFLKHNLVSWLLGVLK